MSTFQTVTPGTQPLDPLKRVNYTFGLVLGVDEFLQEQTYLIEKDHSQYRLAHGYGTVCGLQVRIVDGINLELRVSPGVAINPQGQEIHVGQEMCARLNDWLTANQTILQSVFGSPPLSLPLCVVLCYRECPSDMVPVPGEPCRTQQDTMAASHITESFQLKLCLDTNQFLTSPPMGSPAIDTSTLPDSLCFRPSQTEEDAIRQFGQLLHRIRITDAATTFLTQQELEDLVRQLAASVSAPASSPPVFSPPVDSLLYLHPSDACAFLRAAFLVWVTEVRPVLMAQAGSSDCCFPGEQCVLLAELTIPVSVLWNVAGTIAIDETRRPYLVQSRLLQECLLCGLMGTGAGMGQASFMVAGGTFSIAGGLAFAAGPTYNGLTATPHLNLPGEYLLAWTGTPAYSNPATSSPARSYVVNGTAINGGAAGSPSNTVPQVFEVLDFQDDGVLIRVLDVQGKPTATGFTVEIKEITGGF